MDPALEELRAHLACDIARVEDVGGGCINHARRVDLADGTCVFVKSSANAPRGAFAAEAAGLQWLASARAVGIPAVVAHNPRWIALEWIEAGAARSGSDEELGRGLAALHASGAPCFGGGEADTVPAQAWLAELPLDNAPCGTWAEFYARHRLDPMLRICIDGGHLPRDVAARVEALCARMPEHVGPEEPPARLHGDLWGGNLVWDAAGHPWLVDPAAYGGNREVDLAMMRLFGGFGSAVFAAYDEVTPLSPGWEERVPLYQVFPLLVHVALFGPSYVASLDAALRRVV